MPNSEEHNSSEPRNVGERTGPDPILGPTNVSRISVDEERKRPRLLAILFCDFANMTKDDKPNLVGVFDRIFVDSEEKKTPIFFLYLRLAELNGTFYTTVFGPNKEPALQIMSVLKDTPRTLNLPEGLPFQNHTTIGIQLTVNDEGIYWFDISYEGNSLGGAGLPIHYRETGDSKGGTATYI